MSDETTDSPEAADKKQPLCREHPGCFANMAGFCAALKASPPSPCPFFKTTEDHRRGQARAFYGLVSRERFDLIRKYIVEYRDAGFFDAEIYQAEEHRTDMEAYAEENLVELREFYALNPFIEQAGQYQDTDDWEEDDAGEAGDTDHLSGDAAAVDEEEASDDDETDDSDESFPENIDDKGIRELEELSRGVEDDIAGAADTGAGSGDGTEETYGAEMYTNDGEPMTENGDASVSDDEEPDPVEGKTIGVSRSLLPMPKERRINRAFEETYGMFAAEIIFQAADDYALVLRKLWSGRYGGLELENLIVDKWEAESFFGSHLYWQLTNLNPERILDQCERNAIRGAEEAAVRRNRRTIAGVDSVYDDHFIDKWRRERIEQKKTQRFQLSWDAGGKADGYDGNNGGKDAGGEEDGK